MGLSRPCHGALNQRLAGIHEVVQLERFAKIGHEKLGIYIACYSYLANDCSTEVNVSKK